MPARGLPLTIQAIRLAPELWAEAAKEQAARLEDEPWTEVLGTAFGSMEGKIRNRDVRQLIGFATAEKLNNPTSQRIIRAMKELGWSNDRKFRFMVREKSLGANMTPIPEIIGDPERCWVKGDHQGEPKELRLVAVDQLGKLIPEGQLHLAKRYLVEHRE
jgi:hypothetical protein